jgi:hypothetical protein
VKLRITVRVAEDVDEYISMCGAQASPPAGAADNPQLARIRQHFEKKNKKHVQETERLQVEPKACEFSCKSQITPLFISLYSYNIGQCVHPTCSVNWNN